MVLPQQEEGLIQVQFLARVRLDISLPFPLTKPHRWPSYVHTALPGLHCSETLERYMITSPRPLMLNQVPHLPSLMYRSLACHYQDTC